MKTKILGLAFILGVAIAQQPLDTNFTAHTLLLSQDLTYQILFQKGDPVLLDNRTASAKGKLDFLAYQPIDGSTHGYLWTNHETIGPDEVLGHGGGATVLEIQQQHGKWQTMGSPMAVDFGSVNGTWNNCLGFATPWGTVLTSEEYEPRDNAELYQDGKGVPDTSDINGKPAYLNYGWMVEVEVATGKVLGKRTAMGRFSHEGNLLMPDNRTVYMMDDFAPGIFFKFVADKPRDMSKGQLYAYKQEEHGGVWLPLPRTMAVLEEPRRFALQLGATVFLRLEDLILANDGFIYLTETGKTEIDLKYALDLGGKPARHQVDRVDSNGVFRDVYGRILRFNPKTQHIQPYLEGGGGAHGQHLGNPDNISYNPKTNTLVIHEDINEADRGRVPAHAEGVLRNELYLLKLDKAQPTIDDLQRILIAPPGSETTGSCFTPDYRHLFVNIQHPSPQNPAPFNWDATIVISGWDD